MSSIGTLLERLYVSIGADLSELRSEMASASRTAKSSAADIGKSFQAVGDKLTGWGQKLSLGVTAPLAAIGVASAKAASDAGELQSAFDATFGDMSKAMNEWAESTGNALGRSTQEMQQGANAFGLYFNQAARTREEAAKMSQTFTVLAQDLASFHNTSVDEALLALRSGLSGETEPLRRYGVFLNEAAIQAKALEMGLTPVNGKLTDQQKIMARSAIIMDATKTAQGDVLRTSSSTANQLRSLNAAWEEMTVAIGNALLPVLTPVVGFLADLANKFTQLDPTIQKVVIGVAAAAAAIGPLLMVVGMMASGIGAILPLLGGAGLAGLLGTIGTVALPVVAVVAGLAAAWALFGDKIGPVLSEFGTKVQEVLGPKLVALFETVKTTAMELWNGPLGEGIRKVIAVFGEFQAAYLSILGEALVRVLSAALDIITTTFEQIGNVIGLVVALLQGDWSKAWDYAKQIVQTSIDGTLRVIESLVPGATDAMKRLYDGVKTWIQDRLNAVWDWVIGKVETVKNAFFGLYDAVVGHSYIPDMVDGIESEMRRLDAVMVDPVRRATESSKAAFRSLAQDTGSLLDSLFPLEAQLRRISDDMDTLERARSQGLISDSTYNAAQDKLVSQRMDVRRQQRGDEIPLIISQMDDQPLVDVTKALEGLNDIAIQLPEILTVAQIELQEFGQGLGNDIMGGLRDVLSGRKSFKDMLANLFQNFLFNAVTSALKNLETSIFGEGGLGGFLGNVLSGLISGGSRAVGGPTLPGRAYDVGWGEKFVPGQAGRVLSRSDAMKAVAGQSGGGLGRIHVSVSGARGNQEIMEMVRSGVEQGIGQYDRVVGQRVDKSFKRRA